MIYLKVINPFTIFKQIFAEEAECVLIANYCFDIYIAELETNMFPLSLEVLSVFSLNIP